ncbi:MAG TPA: hypothetical protein VIL48_16890 [Acidimicrobiales bacterium]
MASPSWRRSARRYGPFVAVVVVVAVAVAAFGGGGDGDDDGDAAADADAAVDTEALVASGPMTWERAEAEGRTDDIDWGPGCDTGRGAIALPTVLAPPCVEPFTGDNGGATSPGVTEDEIRVVYYQSDPALDPTGTALVTATGAEVDPETERQVVEEFVDLFNAYFETYGRRVVVDVYTGTGASGDPEAARADAIAIAEREPFAVLNGPLLSGPVFAGELAERGVICAGNCATAVPEEVVRDGYPYIWPPAPTPDQAAALAAEAFGNLAGPGPAELAGDPELRERDRVYALVHYDTPDGDHEGVYQALRDQLAEHDIELETDVRYELDFAQMQENARTIITRLQDAGVTTVVLYGDPLTMAALTREATTQDYAPEWLLGPNLFADTAVFARQMDADQWRHGFGLSFTGTRGETSTQDGRHLYEWAYGGTAPNDGVDVIDAQVRSLFNGIHLAGPELTPETFRDGLFRLPVRGGGPTVPQVSVGDHGVWPELDLGGADDIALLWWDPDATGEDETGNPGRGMYRYANGGERYTLGNLPESFEEAGLFDEESSVTVYDELPEEDRPPEYPPPDL